MDSEEPRKGLFVVEGRATGAEFALPPLLYDVFSLAKSWLEEGAETLFDEADSALFDMAERAQLNTDQNMYFEAMRTLRLARRAVAMRFAQEVSAVWQAILQENRKPLPRYYSTGNLAVIGKEELEEIVAIEGMVARAAAASADELSLLSLRIERVLPGRSIANELNPLAPQFLANAFAVACEQLAIALKAKLFFYKLFEKHLISRCDDLFHRANQVLADAGILPNVRLVDVAGGKRREGGTSRRPVSEAAGSENGRIADDETYQVLHDLLIAARQAARGAAFSEGSEVSVLRRASLVNMLAQLQRPRRGLGTDAAGYIDELPPHDDLTELLLRLARDDFGSEHNLAIGENDAATIELVSMLMDQIVEDRYLELPLKALLVLLRVPLARMALNDKSVFGRQAHPARRLLDEVGAAGMGWRPGGDASRDFLYRKVREVVEYLIAESSGDTTGFQVALNEFMAYREAELKRSAAVERRSLDTEMDKIQAEAIRQAVTSTVGSKLAGAAVPDDLVQLLLNEWCKVIFGVAYREGMDCENAQLALRVVDDLVWSVSPKTTAADRQRLQRLRSSLHRSMYNGLSRIGMSHFVMSRLFNRLDAYQDEALIGSVSWLQESTSQGAEPEPSSAHMLADPRVSAELGRLRVGHWVEFRTDTVRRLRLAAVVQPPGTFVFVDRSGHICQELGRERMAELFYRGQGSILDERKLFDRALEHILGLLQASRPPTADE